MSCGKIDGVPFLTVDSSRLADSDESVTCMILIRNGPRQIIITSRARGSAVYMYIQNMGVDAVETRASRSLLSAADFLQPMQFAPKPHKMSPGAQSPRKKWSTGANNYISNRH